MAILVSYRHKCFKEKKNLLIRLDIANSNRIEILEERKTFHFHHLFFPKYVCYLLFLLRLSRNVSVFLRLSRSVSVLFRLSRSRKPCVTLILKYAKCRRFNFSYPVHCVTYIYPNVWQLCNLFKAKDTVAFNCFELNQSDMLNVLDNDNNLRPGFFLCLLINLFVI